MGISRNNEITLFRKSLSNDDTISYSKVILLENCLVLWRYYKLTSDIILISTKSFVPICTNETIIYSFLSLKIIHSFMLILMIYITFYALKRILEYNENQCYIINF